MTVYRFKASAFPFTEAAVIDANVLTIEGTAAKAAINAEVDTANTDYGANKVAPLDATQTQTAAGLAVAANPTIADLEAGLEAVP